MAEPLLRVEHLKKSYDDEDVLTDVSVTMEEGDANVIIGPSGSGKSTLLRCINRLTEIDGGEVYLDGELTSGPDFDVNELRREVGMVFQDINLFAHHTALENVTLGLKRVLDMDEAAAREKAMAQLEQVGLENKADSYPAELSGGQQQRVGIARALAMDPKLMLFDEPTSSLDPELTGEVVDVMKRLAEEGMTMLVVTHEMGFARSAATNIMFLDGGEFVEIGPPEQIFESPEHDRTAEFLERITEAEAEGTR
ncbi:MAG: amino acid ABC transporter ATP-binding protein [Halanaeroarchaeum sp.]